MALGVWREKGALAPPWVLYHNIQHEARGRRRPSRIHQSWEDGERVEWLDAKPSHGGREKAGALFPRRQGVFSIPILKGGTRNTRSEVETRRMTGHSPSDLSEHNRALSTCKCDRTFQASDSVRQQRTRVSAGLIKLREVLTSNHREHNKSRGTSGASNEEISPSVYGSRVGFSACEFG
jgi:hypothetical protein